MRLNRRENCKMSQSNKRRSWKGIIVTLTLVLTLTLLSGCGSNGDNVVATYEGGQITQEQFDKEMANRLFLIPSYQQPQYMELMKMDEFREFFIREQIAYLYLADKAPEESKAQGKKMSEEQFKEFKAQIGEADFKKMLDAQKLTEQEVIDYRARLLTVVDEYNKKVTEEQIKKQFDLNQKDLTTASVRHILIGFTDKEGKERTKEEALKIATDLKGRLDKGEDFATLAKEYSEDGNASTGGLYEDKVVSGWVTEFKNAVLTLPLNTISDPVETQYGYHVMRVEKRTEKTYDKLTEAEKNQLRSMAASELIADFIQGDLEKKIIKSIDLPKLQKDEPKKEDSSTPSADNTDKPEDGETPSTEGSK